MEYAEYKAIIEIAGLTVSRGTLPRRAEEAARYAAWLAEEKEIILVDA